MRCLHAGLALTSTILFATPLYAAPGGLNAAFGSTIVSTYPDGRTAELWLHQDGSYAAEGRRGDGSDGHWKVKGDKLCLRQSKPLPAPFSYCTPIPPDGLHEAWSARAVTGEPIRVKLVKGRYLGKAADGAAERPQSGSQAD